MCDLVKETVQRCSSFGEFYRLSQSQKIINTSGETFFMYLVKSGVKLCQTAILGNLGSNVECLLDQIT